MPIMDGWTLCKELRRANPDIPLLMLTARGETWEKVKGFELGTEDYLTKPFDPLELTVRIRAYLLVEDEDGYLILSPSTSPENAFIYVSIKSM